MRFDATKTDSIHTGEHFTNVAAKNAPPARPSRWKAVAVSFRPRSTRFHHAHLLTNKKLSLLFTFIY